MRLSPPDKPMENLQDVVKFLKKLRDSSAKHFPYTSGRIQEAILILKKEQQRVRLAQR